MGKRDNLMLKVDELACSVLSAKSGLLFKLKANKKLYSKNAKLKKDNREQNVCFVLGNGPSLKTVNFDDIKNHPCMTVNMFYRGTDTYFSDYHLFLDPVFSEDSHFGYVKEICEKSPDTKLIVQEPLYKRLCKENIPTDNVHMIAPKLVQCKNEIKYDMTKCMTGSLNVIPVAIECAMYMGYKKIYLLGCDFNSYAVCKDEHFYEQKADENVFGRAHEVGDLIRCALVHKQHYAIDDAARKAGIEIVNLTEGSLVNAYKKEKYAKKIETLKG